MTLEDLADHMRRVRLGEVAPSPDEVDPEAVQRWEELLRGLATPKPTSPVPMLVSARCPTCEAYRNGVPDMGRRQHFGCEWT